MPVPLNRKPLDPLLARSEWRVKMILVWTDRKNQRTMPARCLRYVAVHPAFGPDEGRFSVTVIGVGRRALSMDLEEEARKVAKYLDTEVGDVLAEPIWETLMGRMPLWVRPWIQAMFFSHRWTDPAPYRRKP